MGIQSNTLLLQPEHDPLKQWIQEHQYLMGAFLDAFCIVDVQNQVVEFNVAFTELMGISYRKIQKIKDFDQLVQIKGQAKGENETSFSRKALTTGKPVRYDEIKGSTQAFPDLRLIVVAAPILNTAGTVLGAIVNIRNVSAEDELQKKYLERKQLSITDGLTTLYNKAYTEDSLLRLVKTSLRTVNSFSLAMLDVDFFKKVNDTYGHQAGDYVLTLVAQILKSAVRGSDIVGRFGGEEFMVVLSNANAVGAHIFAERFRERIEKTDFQFDGKKIPVTISIGTSTFDEKWRLGLEPNAAMKAMINKADKALYYSKQTGRNRTSQYESMPADKK